MFNYGPNVAPHFDALVPSTSGTANPYEDLSWSISQTAESTTAISSLTHATQSTMAILPQYQAPAVPPVQPEVVVNVNSPPVNEGPKMPDIYATIPIPSANEQSGSDRKKDGRKHACHMCHKSFDRYVFDFISLILQSFFTEEIISFTAHAHSER